MTLEYIAIGPFVWGRGATIDEAKKKMKYMLRGSSVKPGYSYYVYEVGPDTTVDGMGSLSYPMAGPKPKIVEQRVRKVAKK